MEMLVRPAMPDDPCVALLFESAKPYYTAYAGSEKRALALLQAVFKEPTHAASYDCCTGACVDGELVGVVAGFPVSSGDHLSHRFIRLTLPKLPPWRWWGTFRHLRAARRGAPAPPPARRRPPPPPPRPPTPITSTRWPSPRSGGAGASRAGSSTWPTP